MTFYNDVEEANRRIQELEAEILQLKGGMEYLENSKIKWLEQCLEDERRKNSTTRGKA
jgi:hypothetical protein